MPFHIECQRCRKKFIATWSKAKFCSRSCVHRNRTGLLSSHWKGGRIRDSSGYILHRINGRYVLEHRFLMEQKLGRKLNSNEHVHHINGNKQDNRLENLIVLQASAHQSYHHPRINLPRPCKVCGTLIQSPEKTTVVCSLKCRHELRRKVLVLRCHSCHRVFKRTPCMVKNSTRRFCSAKCRLNSIRPPMWWLSR